MSLAELSIKRPIFITSLIILMLASGLISFSKLPVDQFPAINFPVVMVRVFYSGAGPEEVEKMVAKPIEEELSTLSGIQKVTSISKEGSLMVICEFALEKDVKESEQEVRDRVALVRPRLPEDIQEPVIRRFDPTDQPVLIVALTAAMDPRDLFDLADNKIKPRMEQLPGVGMVELLGGRKREIQVLLDREKLKDYETSATQVAGRLAQAGQNIPAGKLPKGERETSYRTVAEYSSLKDISATIVQFIGNDVPVTLRQLGQVVDGMEDENSRTFVNGRPSISFMVFRQSGSNTVQVADGLKARLDELNKEMSGQAGAPYLEVVQDSAKPIKDNVDDVKEAIVLGILLTILVVYFFLGNWRSTFITGLALPNSLIGAFIIMAWMGFSINIMSMMAMSLAVGLLIDDAIVVRENIYRHMELGKPPIQASLEGTREVTMAVLATSFTILAVFGPIGFLSGVVGQFFREFGLTICFIIIISTFDALTIAPMLSAYFVSKREVNHQSLPRWQAQLRRPVEAFDRLQDKWTDLYEKALRATLKKPLRVLAGAGALFVLSLGMLPFIPKTFFSAQDTGMFAVTMELPAGASMDRMHQVAMEVEKIVKANPEVVTSVLTVGSRDLQSNKADLSVQLAPEALRSDDTDEIMERVRKQLKPYEFAKANVKNIGGMGGGERPFNLNIAGNDLDQLEKIAQRVFDKIKDHPSLKAVDLTLDVGRPEFQAKVDSRKAEMLGVSTTTIGQELRTQIEGSTPGLYRENGLEYNIRVRLQDDQRDLHQDYNAFAVPNINGRLIRLANVAEGVEATSQVSINRKNRTRYIRITADINNKGPGLGQVMSDLDKMFKEEIKLPEGVTWELVGQAERFKEMMVNMVIAMGLGVLFIYLVLASLYESFITPLTLMLVLPLATIGAFGALLITRSFLDIFAMIGMVLLFGIATKNSILLVDYTRQLVAKGMERKEALVVAGRTRLRPILMTTFALIAGMLPVAVGLNEVSKHRTSMGVGVIGGLITSTLLTLLVVPAAYCYIDDFRNWSLNRVKRLVHGEDNPLAAAPQTAKAKPAKAGKAAKPK